MQFIQHGYFAVKAEGNIVHIDLEGPFNKECVIEFEKALKPIINSLEHSSWMQVVTLSGICLHTPDAQQVFFDSLLKRRERGLIASAVLLEEVEGVSLTKQIMSRCYDKANIRHKFLKSKLDAKAWLASI